MVPKRGLGPEPLITQPFAGEQVQGERAQIENIKQVAAVPDGDKYQQVEQKMATMAPKYSP